MSRYPMDRYNEQRLTQEVLYLHSLWHQGPPRPHHPTTLTPTPSPTPLSLQPSSSTQFKKRGKKNSRGIKKPHNGLDPTNPPTDSGTEWPCPTPAEPPAATDSGWPTLTTKSTSQPHLPTAQELTYFAANQAHQQALKAVSEHLKCSNDDTENDDHDDDDDGKDYNFFVKLFAEDGALREYYDKNRESGEFSCLVCCGAGKKGWKKRFKDCVALVQHSVAIANTNTWQAHRAYGHVICQILGWDINRLPSIVLSAPDNKPTESSDKPVKDQGNEDDGGKNGLSGLSNTTDAVNISNDKVSEQKESFSNENRQENGGGSGPLEGNEDDGGKNVLSGQSDTTNAANISSDKVSQQKESFSNENQQENGGGSALLQHNSPSEASANRVLEEDISNSNIPAAKENAEGASNSREALQEDMIVANDCEKDDVSKEAASISDKS